MGLCQDNFSSEFKLCHLKLCHFGCEHYAITFSFPWIFRHGLQRQQLSPRLVSKCNVPQKSIKKVGLSRRRRVEDLAVRDFDSFHLYTPVCTLALQEPKINVIVQITEILLLIVIGKESIQGHGSVLTTY